MPKHVACALAVFAPFEVAAVLLALLTGVEVSPGSIWNWVQQAGADGAMVPFRPQPSLPRGRTIWREVKVGVVAR